MYLLSSCDVPELCESTGEVKREGLLSFESSQAHLCIFVGVSQWGGVGGG